MSTMTFNLYGELGEKYGKTFELECGTVRQGLDILFANFKTMKQHIIDSDKWLAGYEVWANEVPLEATDTDFTLVRQSASVKIIPVVCGASSTARIIIGVVMVVVGAVLTYFGNPYGPLLMKMGVVMIIGGVAEKLAPKPKLNSASERNVTDKATSYIFSGPVNNTKQGAAVPIGYGRMLVGSNVISSAFTTVDIPV